METIFYFSYTNIRIYLSVDAGLTKGHVTRQEAIYFTLSHETFLHTYSFRHSKVYPRLLPSGIFDGFSTALIKPPTYRLSTFG